MTELNDKTLLWAQGKAVKNEKTPSSEESHGNMTWEPFLSDLDRRRSERYFDREFSEQAGPGTSLIYKTVTGRISSKGIDINSEFNSCSKWTLNEFNKCIDFDDLRRLNIGTKNVDHCSSLESIISENLHMFQIDSKRPDIHKVLRRKVDVRILINSILQNLCKDLKFGVKTEEKIKPVGLPSCKFDFLFYNHRGKPIGCLKTKSSSTMNSKAFVQAVLELFVLQQFASEEKVDVKKVPLFNILTDGRRFVLLQVKGDKILVEQNEDNKLKIHTDGVMESLYRLIQMSVDASVE